MRKRKNSIYSFLCKTQSCSYFLNLCKHSIWVVFRDHRWILCIYFRHFMKSCFKYSSVSKCQPWKWRPHLKFQDWICARNMKSLRWITQLFCNLNFLKSTHHGKMSRRSKLCQINKCWVKKQALEMNNNASPLWVYLARLFWNLLSLQVGVSVSPVSLQLRGLSNRRRG